MGDDGRWQNEDGQQMMEKTANGPLGHVTYNRKSSDDIKKLKKKQAFSVVAWEATKQQSVKT